jgi:hypothetical protein
VLVTAANSPLLSRAVLVATKPDSGPRLIYRIPAAGAAAGARG